MKIMHEWNFHNRVCRVVESEPGIVHFEEATRTTGDPSIMLFNHTPTPMGAANEIIQLSMALAEANVINRDLSAAIQRWQEDRNASEQEIERLRAELEKTKLPIWILREEHEQEVSALRARVAVLEEYLRLDSQELEDELGGFYLSAHHSERWYELRGQLLRTKPIPLSETKA
jgi:hypothetical protein